MRTEAEVRHLLEAYDDQAQLAEASTIPGSWYCDARIAELERSRVFSQTWQVAGRACQLQAPGDFVTTEIAGEPVLVVRGKDGLLRAFLNVCRHHAAAVVDQKCGRAELLRCPYHGWTYGLNGTLKGAPEFNEVRGFDRDANGLVPVWVDRWENWIFVSVEKPAVSLANFIGDLAGSTAPLDLSSLSYYASREYTLQCNWKVFVDNYLDGGYHVPHLHKGLNSVLEYKDYTIENGERYCLQSSPLVTSALDEAVGATRRGGRAYYWWLYPNFMINVYQGVMDTNLVVPLGIDKTLVIFDFFFADVTAARAAHNAESVAVSDRVQQEDVGICESVQRGVGSRAYRAGRLSVRREAGEHLFHRLLARQLKQD